jgi:hypothetical protein
VAASASPTRWASIGLGQQRWVSAGGRCGISGSTSKQFRSRGVSLGLDVSGHPFREAAFLESFWQIRIDLNGFINVFDGESVLTLVPISTGAGIIGVGKFRIDLDRPIAILDGAFVVALVKIGVSTIVIGIGIIRKKRCRPIAILDGEVVFAFFVTGESEILKGSGQIRIDLDRPVAVLDGLVILAFLDIGVGAVDESLGGIRIERAMERSKSLMARSYSPLKA